jgi:hypothetical protein
MANQSTTAIDETPEYLFHDHHLDLHEPIQAFHAEMMGYIMYYNHALQQPDSKRLLMP